MEEEPLANNFCLKCGKKLKKFTLENGEFLNYHKQCWKELINDIKNFEKVAYTKYNYKKRICGLTQDEIDAGAPIVVHFD